MKELIQAGDFYTELTDEQKKEVAEAIAEHIYFLDENLQQKIIAFLKTASCELGENISIINSFTM